MSAREQKKKNALHTMTILISLMILTILITFSGSTLSNRARYILYALFFISINAVFIAYDYRAYPRFDWLEPPKLLFIILTPTLVIPPIFYWSNRYWRGSFIWGSFEEYFVGGLALLTISFFLMWLAYTIAKGVAKRKADNISPNSFEKKMTVYERTLSGAILLYVLGVAIRLINLLIGNYGYFSLGSRTTSMGFLGSITSLLYYISLACLLLFIFDYADRRSKRALFLIIGGFLIEVGFSLISGMKLFFFILAVELVAGLYYANIRIRLRTVLILALLVLLVIPINEYFRASVASSRTREPKYILRNLEEGISGLAEEKPVETLRTSAERFLYRTSSMIYFSGLIHSYTPRVVPYAGFMDFLSLPIMLVPRAVWGGKPTYSSSLGYFMSRYLGMVVTPEHTTGLPLWGDFYRYAGWVSLIMLSIVWGILLAIIYSLTVRKKTEMHIVFYVALFPILFNYEMTMPALLQWIVQMGLTMWIIVRFILYRKIDHKHNRNEAVLH